MVVYSQGVLQDSVTPWEFSGPWKTVDTVFQDLVFSEDCGHGAWCFLGFGAPV